MIYIMIFSLDIYHWYFRANPGLKCQELWWVRRKRCRCRRLTRLDWSLSVGSHARWFQEAFWWPEQRLNDDRAEFIDRRDLTAVTLSVRNKCRRQLHAFRRSRESVLFGPISDDTFTSTLVPTPPLISLVSDAAIDARRHEKCSRTRNLAVC